MFPQAFFASSSFWFFLVLLFLIFATIYKKILEW